MMTISGRNLRPDNFEAPSLYDIGYSLSKVPRFGGHTTKHWTVLHHLLGCYRYALETGEGPRIALYALLHDAHEAVTGDIPHPWKTDSMKVLQRELDAKLFGSLGIGLPDLVTDRVIKRIDETMVVAEAEYATPEATAACVKKNGYDTSGLSADNKAKEVVETVVEWLDGVSADEAGRSYEQMVKTLIGWKEENKHVGD